MKTMQSHQRAKRRRSIRLIVYDYSGAGAYFVTICAQNLESLLELPLVRELVKSVWYELPSRFPSVQLDEFVIMPNHVHGIIIMMEPVGAGPRACPNARQSEMAGQPRGVAATSAQGPTLGQVVHWFKSFTTAKYRHGVKYKQWAPFPGRLWQRNYYERVVRNEEELHRIREYIQTNPVRWALDHENPDRIGDDEFDLWLAFR